MRTILHSFLVLLFTFIANFFFAQDYSQMSLIELEQLKSEAAASENYQEANKIKTIIELKKKLKIAADSENYAEAAKLKSEIQSLVNGKIQETSTSQQNRNGALNFEFYNKVYVVEAGQPNLELEIQNSMQSTSTHIGYGFYKSIIFDYVPGQYSSTQLKKGRHYKLYYKAEKGIDPNTTFKMAKLELSAYETALTRRYISNEVKAATYKGDYPVNFNNIIPLTFNKISDDIYELSFDQLIEPGEYAIMNGNNWHLFGVQDVISLNPNLKEPTEIVPIEFYENDYSLPKLAFLGVDYSLCKFTSTKNMGRDFECRNAWDKGNMKFYKSAVKQGRIEGWLSKPGNLIFYPEFGRSISAKQFPEKWILPDETQYSISIEELEKHIQNYQVNFPGLGMVILPEFFQMKSKDLTGYVVIYDFRTRKIVDYYHAEFGLAIDNGFDDDDFEANFLRILKYYIDRKFIPEHEAYIKAQKKKQKK
jgi:hypothetical protein